MKAMKKTKRRRKPYRKTAPPIPIQDPNATAEDVARALLRRRPPVARRG